MFRALLACFLLVSATSLIVPLYNAFPRCMVVFSFGDKETVKIDMKFPQIPHKQGDEAYEIYYKNTDTNETFYEVSGPGQYRKELEVNQSTRRVTRRCHIRSVLLVQWQQGGGHPQGRVHSHGRVLLQAGAHQGP
jgi:hypothetical protein